LAQPGGAAVVAPANPEMLGPHLGAAAAELPLTGADVRLFGSAAPALIADLARQGIFRDRGGRWDLTGRKAPLASLRGTGGRPVRVVEKATGRLIGTMDEPSSHT